MDICAELTYHRPQCGRTLERSPQENVRYRLEVIVGLAARPRRDGPAVSIPDLESSPLLHPQLHFPICPLALERVRHPKH